MSERWSNKLMESWKPCFAYRDGQQLNLILPQLQNDVRRQIAQNLDFTDQARCLMVTSSGWKQEGTVQMLEELEANYKLRQRFRQLEQAQATEKASAAIVTATASPFLAPHRSKRNRHSFLDAVEKQLLSLQDFQQAVMQAKE